MTVTEIILMLIGFFTGIAALTWFVCMVEDHYKMRKATNAILNHLGLEVGDSYVLTYVDREEE